MDTAGQWQLMVLWLPGEPLPEPPALQGRLVRQAWSAPDDEALLAREAAAAVVWWALVREGQQP